MVADLVGAGSESECGEQGEHGKKEAAWCFHGSLIVIVTARSFVCLGFSTCASRVGQAPVTRSSNRSSRRDAVGQTVRFMP